MLIETKLTQVQTTGSSKTHPKKTPPSKHHIAPAKASEEATKICAELFSEMVEDVISLDTAKNVVYLFADSPETLLTINVKVMSGLGSLETLDLLTVKDSTNQTHKLKQLKVVQQVVYNLCGYHAIFS